MAILKEQLKTNKNYTPFALRKILSVCTQRHFQIFELVCEQLESHVGGNIPFHQYVEIMKKISELGSKKPPQLLAKIEEHLELNFKKLSLKMIQDLVQAYLNLPKESKVYGKAVGVLKSEFYEKKFMLSVKVIIQFLPLLPECASDILTVLQKRSKRVMS